MKAKCIKNKYARKGSQVQPEPSFIEGKVYEFADYSLTINYYGLGDYETMSEHGVSSVMSEKVFNKYFEWV